MTSLLYLVLRGPITVELWFCSKETWSLHTFSPSTYLKEKVWLLPLATMWQWWTSTKMGESMLVISHLSGNRGLFGSCRSGEEPSFQVSWFKEYLCCQIFSILSCLHHLHFGSRQSLPFSDTGLHLFQFLVFAHVLGMGLWELKFGAKH